MSNTKNTGIKIKIRQYTPPQLTIIDDCGGVLGYINHYIELQRLLSDIKDASVSSYSIKYANKEIEISSDGKIGVYNLFFLQELFNYKQ